MSGTKVWRNSGKIVRSAGKVCRKATCPCTAGFCTACYLSVPLTLYATLEIDGVSFSSFALTGVGVGGPWIGSLTCPSDSDYEIQVTLQCVDLGPSDKPWQVGVSWRKISTGTLMITWSGYVGTGWTCSPFSVPFTLTPSYIDGSAPATICGTTVDIATETTGTITE